MDKRRITEIWIYPIKSLAGIRLPKATVQSKGLQYDRRWMLVDSEGRFLTQREHPEMALFHTAIDKDQLVVRKIKPKVSGLPDSIELSLNGDISGNSAAVQIWDDEVTAVEVDITYSKWFSDHLGFACKLVFFPEGNKRDVDRDYARLGEQVSLADAYPFLIIGQASLDELNQKLDESMSMKRFRPNFVFTGGTAHEEDQWRDFRIGSVNFKGVKPCARCVLTTVNPDTGEKGVEPLKTLSTYRRENGKVYFGENLLPLTTGVVSEGDWIEIITTK